LKEEWKKTLREYCYKNGIEYPYSAEEDLGYNPDSQQVPHPGSAGNHYAPAPAPGYGPPPGGFAPAPTYYNPPPQIFPSGQGMPPPHVASPAADFSNQSSFPDKSPTGYNPSSGYSLPPAPEDLNLPKYGNGPSPAINNDQPSAASKKVADDDSDDDEDLMARLRNLQK
jgi:hypothetical protein